MPSWKDRLRQASFGGIPFQVLDSEDSGGRSAAVHLFPLRERPFVEELGREARRIAVEGFLLGDDYAIRRDRLRAKFEGASLGFPTKPGRTLILPTLGTLKALCESFRFRESTEDGRMVRFTAAFVEVGEELEPSPAPDPAGLTDAAADAASSAEASEFAGGVQTAGVIERARTAISDVVLEATARLRHLDVFSGPARDVERLESELTALANEAAFLVSAPADLAARTLSALARVLSAASAPLGALEAYRALFDFPPVLDAGGGLQGDIARENGRQAAELVHLAAVGGAIQAAARMEHETEEDAARVREELSAELDELAATVPDSVTRSLEALRAALGLSVPPQGADLPTLRTITLASTRPALTVAHELYQDEDRAAELVRRNGLRHPLRLPGSVPLQVLSR